MGNPEGLSPTPTTTFGKTRERDLPLTMVLSPRGTQFPIHHSL